MPVPALVSTPVPPIVPFWVNCVPGIVSMVPPPVSSAVARLMVMSAVVRSVPPLKLRGPVAAPRFASALTCTTPPSSEVPPA
ncbi:hypothetical protein LMG28138_01997 [Pararobbsia alpina]|uniref:Uncharacterized protein n=1 Tax=Pararobbsia alpina TaxID=621374 RepID=A0A6S7CB28_9BURK|nr:hypothetical protein LMG28138_01997 [Pararobbsia alpina]